MRYVVIWFVITEFVVITSALLGSFLLGDFDVTSSNATVPYRSMLYGDGRNYLTIAKTGYDYEPGAASLVAFFPAYPLLIRLVATTGLPYELAAVLIANACLFGAMYLFWVYSICRENSAVSSQALAVFALFPTSFFFRMAYSESLFLVCCIASMVAIAKGWTPWIVALLVGATTAVRPVGVALLVPLMLYGWKEFSTARLPLLRTFLLILIGSWGLIAYMGYQHVVFGEALAFAKTQAFHRTRPDLGFTDELISYLSWEPIWSVYDKNSPVYWAWKEPMNPLFNLRFVSPLIFLSAVICLVLGKAKNWINTAEFMLATGLLAIPYFTRAYEMGMESHGRFAAVCFPLYFVVGDLLRRLKTYGSIVVLCTFAFFLVVYSMLFGAGYRLV